MFRLFFWFLCLSSWFVCEGSSSVLLIGASLQLTHEDVQWIREIIEKLTLLCSSFWFFPFLYQTVTKVGGDNKELYTTDFSLSSFCFHTAEIISCNNSDSGLEGRTIAEISRWRLSNLTISGRLRYGGKLRLESTWHRAAAPLSALCQYLCHSCEKIDCMQSRAQRPKDMNIIVSCQGCSVRTVTCRSFSRRCLGALGL